MGFKFFKIVLILLFFFFLASSAQATNFLDVVINEIAWMGTEVSYNDEWIELYNNTNSSINLEGWVLKATDGTPEINLSGTVPAKGFYLLERTDDSSLPGIIANQIYKGALSNKGEHLKLFDNQNNLIDEVNCSEEWFAGNNSTKQTMERIRYNISGTAPESWQTSENPEGTPKTKNSIGAESQLESQTPEISEPPEEPKEETETIIYPSSVIINEVLPSPIGPDTKEEWIEIFNSSGFEVNLSGWQISDKVGSTTTYTLPRGTTIPPFEFLTLLRPETKIVLNNDGDGISLFQPNNNLVESINYGKASLGQSYARRDDNWFWTITLTPGSSNVITKEESRAREETVEESLGEMLDPSGILINEILPSPEGPDAEEEWIEIFNQSEHEVNLSSWKIEDTAGRTKTYTFPQEITIPPQGFLVLARPDSKITLNNDGDGLKLLNPNNRAVDQAFYQRAPEGQSYNRTEAEWVWSEALTPGSPNIVPSQVDQEINEILKISEKQTAGIAGLFPKFRSFFVLLIALVVAIFSGILVFLLKRKIKSA